MASRYGTNGATLVGMRETSMNVLKAIEQIRGVTVEAIEESFEFLYRDMQVTPPTIPEETGHMMNDTWFVHIQRESKNSITANAGFNAPYAAVVHEMTEEVYGHPINWTKPGSGAKFLEKGLNRNRSNMVLIIATRVKSQLLINPRNGIII